MKIFIACVLTIFCAVHSAAALRFRLRALPGVKVFEGVRWTWSTAAR
jgi:hypothetical protein